MVGSLHIHKAGGEEVWKYCIKKGESQLTEINLLYSHKQIQGDIK
jgi:hypothetical protein